MASYVVFATGCSSSPSAVPKLAVVPDKAAEAAVELYDKNGDQVLSEEEYSLCPGIAASVSNFDVDGDGRITEDELAQRFQFWVDSPARLTVIRCQVNLNGRPLPGAKVAFTPETFLAGSVKTASMVTEKNGMGTPGVAAEDLPADLKGIRGIQLGLYRVAITHPDQEIPARYNTDTTLGCEITPSTSANPLVFNLER